MRHQRALFYFILFYSIPRSRRSGLFVFWQQSIRNLPDEEGEESLRCLHAVESAVESDIGSYNADVLIYLAASIESLSERRNDDQQRQRQCFETYLKEYYPGERAHFESLCAVIIETDPRTVEEVYADVLSVLTIRVALKKKHGHLCLG